MNTFRFYASALLGTAVFVAAFFWGIFFPSRKPTHDNGPKHLGIGMPNPLRTQRRRMALAYAGMAVLLLLAVLTVGRMYTFPVVEAAPVAHTYVDFRGVDMTTRMYAPYSKGMLSYPFLPGVDDHANACRTYAVAVVFGGVDNTWAEGCTPGASAVVVPTHAVHTHDSAVVVDVVATSTPMPTQVAPTNTPAPTEPAATPEPTQEPTEEPEPEPAPAAGNPGNDKPVGQKEHCEKGMCENGDGTGEHGKSDIDENNANHDHAAGDQPVDESPKDKGKDKKESSMVLFVIYYLVCKGMYRRAPGSFTKEYAEYGAKQLRELGVAAYTEPINS